MGVRKWSIHIHWLSFMKYWSQLKRKYHFVNYLKSIIIVQWRVTETIDFILTMPLIRRGKTVHILKNKDTFQVLSRSIWVNWITKWMRLLSILKRPTVNSKASKEMNSRTRRLNSLNSHTKFLQRIRLETLIISTKNQTRLTRSRPTVPRISSTSVLVISILEELSKSKHTFSTNSLIAESRPEW